MAKNINANIIYELVISLLHAYQLMWLLETNDNFVCVWKYELVDFWRHLFNKIIRPGAVCKFIEAFADSKCKIIPIQNAIMQNKIVLITNHADNMQFSTIKAQIVQLLPWQRECWMLSSGKSVISKVITVHGDSMLNLNSVLFYFFYHFQLGSHENSIVNLAQNETDAEQQKCRKLSSFMRNKTDINANAGDKAKSAARSCNLTPW